MKNDPKFGLGQRVIVSIPLGDIYNKFDGKTGIVESINTLTSFPEYNLKFDDGSPAGIHFLESDLEAYSSERIVERTLGLKCPECKKGVIQVIPLIDENQKIKVVVFECLFSGTFNLWDNLAEMQQKLDEAKKLGKL